MRIGIDFGTSNSAVAFFRPSGAAEIIETIDGTDYMPSVVADTEQGLVTGQAASRNLRRAPEFTFHNIKRFLGVDYNDQEHGSIHLAEGPDGKVWWRGRNALLSGPMLVAEILKSLMLAAEVRLARKPTGAVIAVPVDFREPQDEAIREAAALAGIKKVDLFREPFCAAMAYSLDRAKYSRVLVYDFGGGTFDATILKIKDGNLKPLGMSGSAQLGGADFDKRLADFAVDKFFEKEGEDLRAQPKQMVGVLRAAEEAKKVLSAAQSALIEEANVAWRSGLSSLTEPVTRTEFEAMTKDLVVRTVASVQDALDQAKMTAAEIDGVLLVGGQSRMPLIRSVLEGMFGAKKIIKDGPKAEQAVALGAAIRAAELDGRIKPAVMQQLVTASVGVRASGGGFYSFIKKGETFPIRRERALRAARDDMAEIELVILQGEDPLAKGNTEVYRCTLPIEPGGRIAVMLDIDRAGRLAVWIADEMVYGHAQEDEAA